MYRKVLISNKTKTIILLKLSTYTLLNNDKSFRYIAYRLTQYIPSMSFLNEVLRHLAREAPKEIVRFCKEHQVLEKTGKAISKPLQSTNDVRFAVSKQLGLERCSICGTKIDIGGKSYASNFNKEVHITTTCYKCQNKSR